MIDLDAIRARADAAKQGPWKAITTGVENGGHWYVIDAVQSIADIHACDGEDEAYREPDAQFIAHAREDIPALLDFISNLEQLTTHAVERAIDELFGTIGVTNFVAENQRLRSQVKLLEHQVEQFQADGQKCAEKVDELSRAKRELTDWKQGISKALGVGLVPTLDEAIDQIGSYRWEAGWTSQLRQHVSAAQECLDHMGGK